MHEKSLESLINYNDPIHQIKNKEFNLALIKFGSFISITQNKRVSQTFILLQLLEDEKIRNIFQEICEIENFQELLLNFLNCYPALTKSKVIKHRITQLFNHKIEPKPNIPKIKIIPKIEPKPKTFIQRLFGRKQKLPE